MLSPLRQRSDRSTLVDVVAPVLEPDDSASEPSRVALACAPFVQLPTSAGATLVGVRRRASVAHVVSRVASRSVATDVASGDDDAPAAARVPWQAHRVAPETAAAAITITTTSTSTTTNNTTTTTTATSSSTLNVSASWSTTDSNSPARSSSLAQPASATATIDEERDKQKQKQPQPQQKQPSNRPALKKSSNVSGAGSHDNSTVTSSGSTMTRTSSAYRQRLKHRRRWSRGAGAGAEQSGSSAVDVATLSAGGHIAADAHAAASSSSTSTYAAPVSPAVQRRRHSAADAIGLGASPRRQSSNDVDELMAAQAKRRQLRAERRRLKAEHRAARLRQQRKQQHMESKSLPTQLPTQLTARQQRRRDNVLPTLPHAALMTADEAAHGARRASDTRVLELRQLLSGPLTARRRRSEGSALRLSPSASRLQRSPMRALSRASSRSLSVSSSSVTASSYGRDTTSDPALSGHLPLPSPRFTPVNNEPVVPAAYQPRRMSEPSPRSRLRLQRQCADMPPLGTTPPDTQAPEQPDATATDRGASEGSSSSASSSRRTSALSMNCERDPELDSILNSIEEFSTGSSGTGSSGTSSTGTSSSGSTSYSTSSD